MTCPPHNNGCFSVQEKEKLSERGWDEEQIKFVESSKVEEKIKELINNSND